MTNADGTGIVRLTYHPALDETPVWSPDGSKILFASDREGELDVFIMNADGSGLTNLTNTPFDDDHPKFSSDGTHIVFNSKSATTGKRIRSTGWTRTAQASCGVKRCAQPGLARSGEPSSHS